MMSGEIDCDKEITVKLTILNYREDMKDVVKEKLYWSIDNGKTDIGWCAGTHIASAIKRLFLDEDKSLRKSCFEAIAHTFECDTEAGDYSKTDAEE